MVASAGCVVACLPFVELPPAYIACLAECAAAVDVFGDPPGGRELPFEDLTKRNAPSVRYDATAHREDD